MLRLLLAMLVKLAAPAVSGAQSGATIDATTQTVLTVAPLLSVQASFVELHSARVEHDLLLFKPTLVGIAPVGAARKAERCSRLRRRRRRFGFSFRPRAATASRCVATATASCSFAGHSPQGARGRDSALAMFAATTILSAHAPRPLRILFDGPVHLGPAIFDGGGMGAGIAGRGL